MTGRGEREERLILLMSPAMSWFQETEFSKNSKETSDLTQHIMRNVLTEALKAS